MSRRYACLLIVLCAVASAAVSRKAVSASRNVRPLALAVDGAQTPEQVPSDAAYELFFRTLRPGSGSGSGAAARASAFAQKAVLTGDSIRRGENSTKACLSLEEQARARSRAKDLLAFVSRYEQRLAQLDGARDGSSAHRIRRYALAEEMRHALNAALGADDAASVDAYVNESVKRRIRIYR